jgi:hypothetical protein
VDSGRMVMCGEAIEANPNDEARMTNEGHV